MKNIFTKHPNSIGETYFQHLKFASKFSFVMTVGGVAGLLHALLPFIFEKTGSNILLKLTQHFIERLPTVDERMVKLAQTIESKPRTSELKE